MIIVPRNVYAGGTHDITLRVSDGKNYTEEITHRLIGPMGASQPSTPASKSNTPTNTIGSEAGHG